MRSLPAAPALLVFSTLTAVPPAALAEGAGFDEEVTVIATTPSGGVGTELRKTPFAVQTADADALERSQSLDLTDYLNVNLASVNVNSAQNNPLQPDVQYRGFSASPLLGLSQGVSVYQNGARINEPLGDAVNWDLLPESAVHSITLVSGANPLFGLNTLGGALSIEMKNGFNFQGTQGEVYGGSWDRFVVSAETGGNNGTWGWYGSVQYFEEEGWRELSDSDALTFFGALSWRDGERSSLDLNYQYGDSELRGNGALPVGLAELDRGAVFTAPDITENELHMFTARGDHYFSDKLQVAGTGFYRRNDTDSFNGDASEFLECEFGAAPATLLEGVEAIEDDVEDATGIDLEDECENAGFADFAALEAAIAPFEVEDLADELSGTGRLSDDAINNVSTREQESYGIDFQATLLGDLFGRANNLVVGVSYFSGESDFNATLELAELDPVTRSTAGLGVGTFADEEATNIRTDSDTWSIYFNNTLELTDTVSLIFGGRFNSTNVVLADQSGERPELNGDHDFDRFNPSVGVTWSPNDDINLYASYSQSSRAPTPIELACNETIADAFEARTGEDDFECRLPNAFLADPPLEQVVAKSYEAGVRGEWNEINYRFGYFHTENQDDIIFQSTGRTTGLFKNVDETLRQGIETAFAGTLGSFDWSLSYSYIEATFEDDFLTLSPNHDFAADLNGNGDAAEIQVNKGDRIPGLPEHILKLGGDYRFTGGFTLGGEMVYNSDQVLRADESNQLGTVDGYAVVNLRASYRVSERFELFARVTNLFDEDFENFGLLGEDPTELEPLEGVISNASPRFLGIGAPRGGWVGLRVRI